MLAEVGLIRLPKKSIWDFLLERSIKFGNCLNSISFVPSRWLDQFIVIEFFDLIDFGSVYKKIFSPKLNLINSWFQRKWLSDYCLFRYIWWCQVEMEHEGMMEVQTLGLKEEGSKENRVQPPTIRGRRKTCLLTVLLFRMLFMNNLWIL